MSNARAIEELEERVGHCFADRALLHRAVTHRSYANERRSEGLQDNERLEFLGDAVLDLVVSHELMERFSELSEGDLSMTRAHMVSEEGLRKVAEDLELGAWLLLGKGEEKSGGRTKASILSDALEAVVAALYLDGGLEVARRFVLEHFAAHTPERPGMGTDHKTRLQELVHARWKSVPVYELVGESGPDHEKLFEVAVVVMGREEARARGRSKKAAEQEAARLAVAALSPSA